MKTVAPKGWHTVTPRIFVDDVPGLVGFMRKVFDADGELHDSRPCEIRIGDSIVMVSGAEFRGPMSACLYVYVGDVDEAYRRAIAAGAATIEKPLQTPYGDRRCVITDKWNNMWQIAARERV
jgi:PhnB protein